MVFLIHYSDAFVHIVQLDILDIYFREKFDVIYVCVDTYFREKLMGCMWVCVCMYIYVCVYIYN